MGGRTSAGQRAAMSHTAALATDDAVRDAALRQAGVVRVRTGLQVLDAARALSGQPVPRGPRVAVVTNSGGTGVELTDLLADEGLVVPELSEPLQKELRAIMPAYASARNPVDMTPAWKLFTTVYPGAIELLARSGEVDMVVPVLLQRSASAEVAVAVRDAAARLRADSVPVPVYVCWVAPRAADEHARVLHEAGVPCFPWPERTAQVAGVAVRCGAGLRAGENQSPRSEENQSPRNEAGAPQDLRAPGRRTQAHRTPRPAMVPASLPAAAPNGFLPSEAARGLLVASGIPVIGTVGCRSAASAAAAADHLGYPVVAKVDHPDLIHKSDAGGVRLGLGSGAEVAEAAAELLGLAKGARVLVQHQHQGVELLVGGVRDPEFGAMVVAGFGGVLVETQRDVRLAVAPVDIQQALAMLSSLRGAAVFRGLRGSPPVHLGFVAEIIVAIADLMVVHPQIAELDLNPLLAGPDGCVAVDWRPVRATVTPTPIMARPPAPPTSANRRGDRANQDRNLLAPSPQVLSDTSPIMIDTRASSSICSGTWPAARFTNCGSTAPNRISALGLVTPTRNPSRTARRSLRACAASANVPASEPRRRNAWIPSQIRYSAPASFSTVNTCAERWTSAPTPTATQIATT